MRQERRELGHNQKEELGWLSDMRSRYESGDSIKGNEIMDKFLNHYEYKIKEVAELTAAQFNIHIDEVLSGAMREFMRIIQAYNSSRPDAVRIDRFIDYNFHPSRVYQAIPKREFAARDRRRQFTNVRDRKLRELADLKSAPTPPEIDLATALQRIQELVTLLPEKPKLVISRRYNLDGKGGATLEDLFEELGVNHRFSVAFQERKAIEMIREMALADKVLQESLNIDPEDMQLLLDRLGGGPFGGYNQAKPRSA